MYKFKPITLSEAMKEGDYLPIFESLRINGMEVEDVLSYLSQINLMEASHNGIHLGILSVEAVDAFCVEVHAYVLPQHRKRSKGLLRAFKEAIYTLTPFNEIRTTVTGDVWPLARFLGFIGFDMIHIEDDVVQKGGKVYDLYHLVSYKEN